MANLAIPQFLDNRGSAPLPLLGGPRCVHPMARLPNLPAAASRTAGAARYGQVGSRSFRIGRRFILVYRERVSYACVHTYLHLYIYTYTCLPICSKYTQHKIMTC